MVSNCCEDQSRRLIVAGFTPRIPGFVARFSAFVQKAAIARGYGQQFCDADDSSPDMDMVAGPLLSSPKFQRIAAIWWRIQPVFVQRAGARIATIAIAALLLSTRNLFQPGIFEYWPVSAVLASVLNEALQTFIVGICLIVTVAVATRIRPQSNVLRALSYLGFLFTGSLIGNLLVGVWLWTRWSFPPFAEILSQTGNWTIIAGFLWLVDILHTRAFHQKAAARAIEVEKVKTMRQLTATRLQVLEAQIEPHFLFNTLANVKRVYRVDPSKGDEALVNLMVYLQSALPQMRRPSALIDEELDLVRAYLELFSMRMGNRLQFLIQRDPTLLGCSMPTMMLITLVENAIKHGLVPSQNGGTIRIVARRDGDAAVVSVADDGVGLGGAKTSGSGIGLVNIKSRLKGAYQDQAQLTIEGIETGGVCATLRFPAGASASDLAQKRAA
jgi:signal transduction histidine kinase